MNTRNLLFTIGKMLKARIFMGESGSFCHCSRAMSNFQLVVEKSDLLDFPPNVYMAPFGSDCVGGKYIA